MKNNINVHTDAYALHWPKFGQLEVVAEGGCVIVLATVGVASSLLAGSSALGTLGTCTEAVTIRTSPFSFCASGVLFEKPFGTGGP